MKRTAADRRPAAAKTSVKPKVYIVEDHPIVREGLIKMIQQEADLAVCGHAAGGEGLLKALGAAKPDLLIVDVSLKDTNGIDVIKEVSAALPRLPILVLSMYDETLYAERAIRAGAKGYVMKEEAAETVIAAMRKLLAGEMHLGERMKARLLNKMVQSRGAPGSSPLERLSDRELEVFRLLGQGYSTRRIAERFHRSIKTIEIYRANIKHKLDLRDAAELIHYAVRWAQTNQN